MNTKDFAFSYNRDLAGHSQTGINLQSLVVAFLVSS